MKKLLKDKKHVFGKDIYLLGANDEGVKYWLEAASWDCEWYWGFGYVETYTNNKNPEKTRDIKSHQHFDGLFLNKGISPEDFKKVLPNTPLSDREIWILYGYMEEFYTMREYADLLHRGNNITSKAKSIKEEKNEESNKKEYERINKILLPELFEKIYKLLGSEV